MTAFPTSGNPVQVVAPTESTGASLTVAPAVGGGVWVAQGAANGSLPGYPQLLPTGRVTLSRLGVEAPVEPIELPLGRVTQMVASPDGGKLLLLGTFDSDSGYYAAPDVLELDLASGAFKEWGALPSGSQRVGWTEDGWLASGGWGQQAWFWRTRGAEAELFTPAPTWRFLGAEGDTLLAVWGTYGAPAQLVRVPEAQLRTYAETAYLSDLDGVERVAEQALASVGAATPGAVFASQEALDGFLDAADALAVEQLGQALPTDAEAYDHLVESLQYRAGPATWALLAAQFLRVDLGREVRFVPGVPGGPTREESWDTPFAQGYDPLAWISSALFDSEGVYQPAETLSGDGRVLVLGVDRNTLPERVREVEPTDLEALLETGEVEALAGLFGRWTDNHELSEQVYRGLLARGRFETVVALAELQQVGEQGRAPAVAAWLAAQGQLAGKKKRKLRALTDTAWTQLGRFPDDAQLLLILADLFDRGGVDDGLPKARACLQRVLKTQRWGQYRETAEQTLQELAAREEQARR